jgi:uncharacterized protein
MPTKEPLRNTIDYIEFTVPDLDRAKDFYTRVFGWKFEEWAPDYLGFYAGHLAGGFTKGEPRPGGPLIVIYSDNLPNTLGAIVAGGGVITKPIFEFPGGMRFHFSDGQGNELGVWSDK